jgi:hypothetical protein
VRRLPLTLDRVTPAGTTVPEPIMILELAARATGDLPVRLFAPEGKGSATPATAARLRGWLAEGAPLPWDGITNLESK